MEVKIPLPGVLEDPGVDDELLTGDVELAEVESETDEDTTIEIEELVDRFPGLLDAGAVDNEIVLTGGRLEEVLFLW